MHLENGDEMPIGIIVCAFGQQKTNTAGPSNEALGAVALKIKELTDARIATQWEVQAFLQNRNQPANKVVSTYGSGSHYITTKQLFTASLSYFRSVGISEIVIVAHPLHLLVIRMIMKKWDIASDFHFSRSYDYLIRGIPYDQSSGNTQWWTRGPIAFAAYLVRATLLKVHGR